MPHVLVAGKLHPQGLALLQAAPGVSFTHVEEISEASYQDHLAGADAMVIRTQPLGAASIARAPRLQVVSRHGVGYDAVDVAALTARGIPLCIAGDTNAHSVAEHAMMLILGCAKRVLRADRQLRAGDWGWRNRLEQTDIAGRRLSILGLGRIGRHLARMAGAFGMEVVAHDPSAVARGWPEGPARPAATAEEALRGADVLALCLPAGRRPILGAADLALLAPGAIVVNTARGGVLDEGALADALRSGHVAAAGIDVFEEEPPARDHPLIGFDQVILTPHTAGLTAEAAIRMARVSVQNVLDHFAGRLDPTLVVNRAALG